MVTSDEPCRSTSDLDSNLDRTSLRARRHKPDWPRAFKALRELLNNADRVELAFEVTLALDGDTGASLLEQMVQHSAGRQLIREQPHLVDWLSDRATLEAMPEGSLGRAYLAHIDFHGLEPTKLVEVGCAKGTDGGDDEPLLRWASQRGSLGHDLSHVLTGYGADHYGEATLLVFSWAQIGGRAAFLLAAGANSRALSEKGWRWIPYVFKAWRRGRQAVCLNALPFETLLSRPLSEVRALVGIDPPHVAHPRGVYRGTLESAISA